MRYSSCLTVLLLASSYGALATDDVSARPNVIVIMSDDMGYSDLGCYGSEIDTPHLDELAANGLQFTQFYNGARCCPTRAALLTGLYAHQAGIGHMMTDRGHEGYRGELNEHCLTLAQVMRSAGYRTYMCGKWHVTRVREGEGAKANWPVQRGFEQFYGTIHGAGSFFDPYTLTRQNDFISPYADPQYQPDTYYYTDAISDHAVRFLDEHHAGRNEHPFFMYIAYTAAHWPMHALEKDIAKYRGKYDAGYAAIRGQRFQRMKDLGVIASDCQLSNPPWIWEEMEHQAWDARNMEVYAAMIDNMDQGIGRIVATLERHGALDNTLILFLQDNGGCAEAYGRGRHRGYPYDAMPSEPTIPPMDRHAFQSKMQPDQTRDGYPVLTGPIVMAGGPHTYIGYGRGWANVSNTPFREYKHWVHEGGISTPLIAHWPGGIVNGGRRTKQLSHIIDIMPTCLELAQANYPTDRDGEPIYPLEGESLVPTLVGEAFERGPLYWEHEGNRAVRHGRWKLVAKGLSGPWELYDIATDRAELIDRTTELPQRAAEMASQWHEWAARSHVLPLNPRTVIDPNQLEPMFDGKTFDGWEGNLDWFRIEDGMIIAGSLEQNIPNNEFLCSTARYEDFEMYLEAKLTGEGDNAGVQFRSDRIPNHHEVIGYQADMGSIGSNLIWGALYDESRRRKMLQLPDADRMSYLVDPHDWNTISVRCQGNRVQIWINGHRTVDYEETESGIARSGVIGLQIHSGPPTEASYRNIRIRRL